MAIVETLEIRFLARLGNLGGQIAAITAALGGLGVTSTAALGVVAGSALMVRSALDRVNLSAMEGEKRQKRLASRLKKTGRALKGVSSAAQKAAEGIGLHKMDEINLVGDQEKKKGGSGGGRGGVPSSGSLRGALEGFKRIREIMESLPGFFERMRNHFKRNLRGFDGWLNRATGGLAGMLGESFGFAGQRAAASLADNLLGRLNTSRPELAEKGRSLLQAVGDALRNGALTSTAPRQAGSTLSAKLAEGIRSGRGGAKSAAGDVTLAAQFGGKGAQTEAQSAGANLSKGFRAGLLSYLEKIRSAAASLAKAALDKLRALLKIASPSKAAFSMGRYFSEGFADGIAASAAQAGRSASALAVGAASALNLTGAGFGGELSVSGMVKAAVNEALGGTSIVVPLHVDGVKLGEASIRGINRVTRAAGRLMLEI